MTRIEYKSLRQNMSISEHQPNVDIKLAAVETKRQQQEQRLTRQTEIFKINEKNAKELVDRLPQESTFTITRRCDEKPSGEISYQVVVKSKDQKSLVFGIPNVDINEKRSYTAFCLETKLMIRQPDGILIENQELTESLYQTMAQMPQTRQTAA